MFKQLWQKLRKKLPSKKERLLSLQPKVYVTGTHDIKPGLIDPDALTVIKKLKSAGFTAYLVGGSVRDLLVGRSPKDYDISTSALPEQVKKLFGRSCLLIGRRFRLAHIRFGKKVIEVATFRSGENESDLIVRDNVWGTPEEDVLRRDFTINGLLYDPEDHSIIDYVGGWEDIHKGLIRTIGVPANRYRQDPVRMIRLLKFKARFGFHVDPETETALQSCKNEIIKSSPARILEEMFKMLESGAASSFFRLMSDYGFLELLFPNLAKFLKGSTGASSYQFLAAADKIQLSYGSTTLDRSVLGSCLLFPLLQQEIQAQFLEKGRAPHLGEIMLLSSTLIKEYLSSAFSHFPRRISAQMNFILSTQYRLTPLSGKIHHRIRLVMHREFPMALKFLKIRSMVNKDLVECYHGWKQFYREHRVHGDRHPHPHQPRKRKPYRRKEGERHG